MTIADYKRFHADVECLMAPRPGWTLDRAIGLCEAVCGANGEIPEWDMLRSVYSVYTFSNHECNARSDADPSTLPIDHAAACVMNICNIPAFADEGRRAWMLSMFLNGTREWACHALRGLFGLPCIASLSDDLFRIKCVRGIFRGAKVVSDLKTP